MRLTALHFLFILALLALARGAIAADLVVVVHPANGVDSLTRDDIINIFMGRYRRFATGTTAIPVDSAAREKSQFYRALVGKELAEINGYWARLIFSGQSSPPRQAESADDVIEIVSGNKGAIGYVERRFADKRVKIVYAFPQ